MDYKPKNRDWVKNAAIVFLAVLLVLTFFSNTIMNRSLPEVATQSVQSGSITAKVRGTGTVTAAGVHTVKAEQTREIRAVMVKAGQSVNAGDVLFVLGEGDSAEVEAAQENLRQLQLSYQRSALGVPTINYAAEEREIAQARIALQEAEDALREIEERASRDIPSEQLELAKAELAAAEEYRDLLKADAEARQLELESKKIDRDTILALYNEKISAALTRVQELEKDCTVLDLRITIGKIDAGIIPATPEEREALVEQLAELGGGEIPQTPEEIAALEAELAAKRIERDEAQAYLETLQDPESESQKELTEAERAVQEAQAAVDAALAAVEEQEPVVQAASSKVAAITAVIDEIMGTVVISEEYKQAKAVVPAAENTLFTLEHNLEMKKISDSKSQSLSYLDLTDIGQQIEKAKKKLEELSGGAENQIVAKVSGTVQSVECMAGETKAKDEVLATIEVPDMGYTLSFTVTNDQARRLKVGDSATVSNYYWGSQITATLDSIRVDPKNPQTNKLLTFNLEGDVNAGSELTISVGQKSANYDLIVPNSAIRSDANGRFVLKIEAKSSPLGNRYIARRVNVEVLAEDDMNSAVTGDLDSWGEYVITTSNAPVKNGDMVRLADNG